MCVKLLLAAVLLAPGAFARITEANKPNNVANQQSGGRAPDGSAENRATGTDVRARQFIQRAAQIHMTEAHLGEMAQKAARSDQVKTLGDELRRDNQNAYQRLSRITDQLALTVPKAIDTEHQKDIKRLDALAPDTFDRRYMQHMKKDFPRRAEWFRQEAKALTNSDLKQYASDQAAAFDRRYERAQALDAGDNATGSNSADRNESNHIGSPALSSSPPASPSYASSQETHGTVTSFERGKSLKLKVRDRIGQHEYNLTGSNLHADVPGDLKPGTLVIVKENIDQNGFQTLEIKPDSSQEAGSSADRQTPGPGAKR